MSPQQHWGGRVGGLEEGALRLDEPWGAAGAALGAWRAGATCSLDKGGEQHPTAPRGTGVLETGLDAAEGA